MKQIDLGPVHETFPLLRFAFDEAGERNFSNNLLWKSFLRFRDELVGVKEPVPLYNYSNVNLTWHDFLDEMQVVYGSPRNLDSGLPWGSYKLFPNPIDSFRHLLNAWRIEWRGAINEFVPPHYRAYINDQENVVSSVEDVWRMLHLSKPDGIDDEMWQYRRWLARRDWFLTNLAMLLDAYSSQFEFYDFVIGLDQRLVIDRCFHIDPAFELPVRQLAWDGRKVAVYCDWSRKSIGSLLFKVLRKQYDGGKTLYELIFDIMRGRFVVGNAEDQELVCRFIEYYFPGMHRVMENDNPISSDKWRATYYKGWTHNIKLELQVQLFDDYVDANFDHSAVNHGYYKSQQMFWLIPIMLPPEMLERFFKINWCDFCREYISFNKKRFEIVE
ncbi:MAG TPA: hypothetical protein PLB38_04180 [bacterium]|nr:hypothetical protein [bacterium]